MRKIVVAISLAAVGAWGAVRAESTPVSTGTASLTVAVQNRAADATAKSADTRESVWSWSSVLDWFSTLPTGLGILFR